VILPAYKGKLEQRLDEIWRPSSQKKIDGKYWMYWLGTAADRTDQMGLSYSHRFDSLDGSNGHAGGCRGRPEKI